MVDFSNWIKKNYFILFLVGIFLVGFFLRVFHFSDWLHFELDQSRDAKVIDLAIEKGPSYLPLLGPRAGGTYLRLGPIFYYMEYLSALIFGNNPAGMAVIVLIFSLLSLPLFYLFCREYFDEKISVSLLAIFSVSLYLVIYARFAWNPNPLPFFVLLLLFAFLKIIDKEQKRKMLWFCVLSASFAIVFQLHFVAMVVLGLSSLGFLLYTRPKLNWKIWLAGIATFMLLFSPVIINDIKTKGENTQEFFKAITKKSNKHRGSFLEKLGANYIAHASKYFLILTGRETGSLVKIKIPQNNLFKADIICKKVKCQNTKGLQLTSLIFFTFSLGLLVQKIRKEKDLKRKKFLVLIAIFLGASFVALTPLAKNLAPRFFLFAVPMPFLLLGLILDFFREKFPKRQNWVFLIPIVFVLINLYYLVVYFKESSSATVKAKEVNTEMIISEKSRVTLELQKKVNDYMKSFYQKNGWQIYFSAPAQYQRSMLYLLEKEKIPANGFKGDSIGGKIYRQGNYFVVELTLSNLDKAIKKHLGKNFELIERKEIGNFTVFHLQPKTEAINEEVQPQVDQKTIPRRTDIPARFNWWEVF